MGGYWVFLVHFDSDHNNKKYSIMRVAVFVSDIITLTKSNVFTNIVIQKRYIQIIITEQLFMKSFAFQYYANMNNFAALDRCVPWVKERRLHGISRMESLLFFPCAIASTICSLCSTKCVGISIWILCIKDGTKILMMSYEMYLFKNVSKKTNENNIYILMKRTTCFKNDEDMNS